MCPGLALHTRVILRPNPSRSRPTGLSRLWFLLQPRSHGARIVRSRSASEGGAPPPWPDNVVSCTIGHPCRYAVVRFGPSGEAWFCCALNSAIHVFMCAPGPRRHLAPTLIPRNRTAGIEGFDAPAGTLFASQSESHLWHRTHRVSEGSVMQHLSWIAQPEP